ncbi:MAG: HAD-IIIC family phosphatase, partial [Candidatus Paceibacterota bacterium]
MTYPNLDIPINGSNRYKYSDSPRVLLLQYRYSLYKKSKAENNGNLYLLDCDSIWARFNYNEDIIRLEVNGSHPERTGALLLAEEFIKTIYSIDTNRTRIKCIVLDCDNTLWDGIIREDGPEKVKLRKRYIEILYMLSQRGILLCLASKNDPADIKVMETVFKTVPAFYRNVVHSKINWDPKSSNIKDLANLLNIGLDTIAFIDDSEFERNEVMTQLPEVHIYNDKQIEFLPYMAEFEPISHNITDDAQQKVSFYKTEAKRHIEEESATKNNMSYESFLKTTELKISFSPVLDADVDRVLEIFTKTNQLNVTMKRTSHVDITKYL